MSLIAANLGTALEQLRANKARALLTILGVVIAVASTITVISVVQGLTGYVAGFLQGFGTNAMWVWPERPDGASGRTLGRVELDLADILAVDRDCDALRWVSPLLRRPSVPVRGGRSEVSTVLEGVSAEYPAIRNYEVAAGRSFGVIDVEQGHRVCVVGRDVARKFGPGDDLVDTYLMVDGGRFRVVGILAEKGSFFGLSQDDIILIPYTTALKMYPGQRTGMAIAAQATTEDAVPEAKAQILNLLRRRHELAPWQPNDFQVRTQDEVLAIFHNMSLVASVVLFAIVGVSLLVGGIGIMNVMLVSVTERTREIGLRKAVGARRRDILVQFLGEAVTLSLLGGLAGVAVGYALSALVSLHPRMVSIVVPWWAVGLGFGISAGTGVVFGLLPAIKAALLSPIEALRHE